MSMEIDLSTPLTDEERSYLLMRGKMAEVERVDALHEVETPEPDAGDGTGPQMRSLLTAEDAATERERLLARLRELDGVQDDEDDEEIAPYEEWTHKELDAELTRRELPKTGGIPQKAARLREDDAKVPQEPVA